MENYSRESLRAKVTDWCSRLAQKWMDIDEAYKSLRAELLSSSKDYVKLYEARTERDAILDNAQSALQAAGQIQAQQSVLDTPPPMMRGQPAPAAYDSIPAVVKPTQNKRKRPKQPQQLSHQLPQQLPQQAPQQLLQQAPQQLTQQLPQQEIDYNNLPPHVMQQLMQYQQSQQQQAPPPDPVKPKTKRKRKVKYPNMINKQEEIPYSAAQWT